MSLRSMMIHQCDIKRPTRTRGSAGGTIKAHATIASGKRCHVRQLTPEDAADIVAKTDMVVDYRVYFDTDPATQKDDLIVWTDAAGNSRELSVQWWYNPHAKSKFWKVYCRDLGDASDSS